MTPLPPQDQSRLEDHLLRGQQLYAIKVYREATGADLATAKAEVQRLEAELKERHPEKFKKTLARGCLLLMLGAATLSLLTGLGILL